ncbi:hypothetical protein Btru_025485 [Bulinus truncatus]|nr:hypothetical protein Btru_025485 [Bulinus truncatus]
MGSVRWGYLDGGLLDGVSYMGGVTVPLDELAYHLLHPGRGRVPFDFDGIVYLTEVKKLITPFRTCVVLISVDALNALALAPEYISMYLDWQFFPAKNKTLLAMAFRGNRTDLQGVTFTIHAVLITVALVAVVALTSALVIQLGRKSRWRQDNTGGGVDPSSTVSHRDRKTVKMVILIATVMVICYLPAVVLSLFTAIVPDFGISGRLSTLFHCFWSIVFILGTAQASVNIFIYYTMSTKYKDGFNELCGRGSRQ